MTVSISQKSREAVLGCLALYDKLSVDEISEFTDLSRATVHRVLATDSRITSHKEKGRKAWLFAVDKEALAVDYRVEAYAARMMVKREESIVENVAKLHSKPIEERTILWEQKLTFIMETLKNMEEQQFTALALQQEHSKVNKDGALAHWNLWRSHMEDVATLGAILTAYADSITDGPFARTPSWYLAFKKEKS